MLQTVTTIVLPTSIVAFVAGAVFGLWCMFRLIQFTKRIHQAPVIGLPANNHDNQQWRSQQRPQQHQHQPNRQENHAGQKSPLPA